VCTQLKSKRPKQQQNGKLFRESFGASSTSAIKTKKNIERGDGESGIFLIGRNGKVQS